MPGLACVLKRDPLDCQHPRSEPVTVSGGGGKPAVRALRCLDCGRYSYTPSLADRPAGWIAPPGPLDCDGYHDAIILTPTIPAIDALICSERCWQSGFCDGSCGRAPAPGQSA